MTMTFEVNDRVHYRNTVDLFAGTVNFVEENAYGNKIGVVWDDGSRTFLNGNDLIKPHLTDDDRAELDELETLIITGRAHDGERKMFKRLMTIAEDEIKNDPAFREWMKAWDGHMLDPEQPVPNMLDVVRRHAGPVIVADNAAGDEWEAEQAQKAAELEAVADDALYDDDRYRTPRLRHLLAMFLHSDDGTVEDAQELAVLVSRSLNLDVTENEYEPVND